MQIKEDNSGLYRTRLVFDSSEDALEWMLGWSLRLNHQELKPAIETSLAKFWYLFGKRLFIVFKSKKEEIEFKTRMGRL